MPAWFTEDELRRVAGDASFRRGREYVDAVAELWPTAYGVRATVRGTETYEVWLGSETEAMAGECDCPFGAGGNFCKHCVAVGLVVLADGRPPEPDDLGDYLRSLDAGELVDLLLEQAKRDPALHRRLSLRAAGATGTPQVAVLRRQLEGVLRVRGFGDDSYADRARDVLDTVRELTTTGHAAEARPLARLAVELITAALSTVDDSTGTVAAVCRRALSLYARACATTRPNPTRLAEWLYRQWLDGPGWPTPELTDFTEALGAAGLATYRTLVHSTPPETPVLRAMREQLATVEGDVDTLVAVLSEDLPAVRAYQRIVAVLKKAGRQEEAIRWAERGAAETGQLELTELLVRSYMDNQRAEDAVELRKADLRESPTRTVYGRLRTTATEAGVWPELRSWALDVLAADGAELVGALLDDGEPEEAWRAAEKYDCDDRLRLEAARQRGETAPEEVLATYRELVEGCLARGGRDSYRQAGLLLRELSDLSARCGEEVECRAFIALLLERHRRRPALLDELRRAGF